MQVQGAPAIVHRGTSMKVQISRMAVKLSMTSENATWQPSKMLPNYATISRRYTSDNGINCCYV
jgi:hypothetical protein